MLNEPTGLVFKECSKSADSKVSESELTAIRTGWPEKPLLTYISKQEIYRRTRG